MIRFSVCNNFFVLFLCNDSQGRCQLFSTEAFGRPMEPSVWERILIAIYAPVYLIIDNRYLLEYYLFLGNHLPLHTIRADCTGRRRTSIVRIMDSFTPQEANIIIHTWTCCIKQFPYLQVTQSPNEQNPISPFITWGKNFVATSFTHSQHHCHQLR